MANARDPGSFQGMCQTAGRKRPSSLNSSIKRLNLKSLHAQRKGFPLMMQI